MARWESLTDEIARTIWDKTLVRFDDCSPFQTYAWGEYNRAIGWQPYRWMAYNDEGEAVAMMLGLLRKYPAGIGLVWSVGGPIGDIATWDESLHQAMLRTTGLKRLYCRFRCDRRRYVGDALQLTCYGWMRSWYTLNTSWSLGLDIKPDDCQLLAGHARNWRRNLERALKSNLNIRLWTNPDIDEMLAVYTGMEKRKNLVEQFSRAELENLFNHVRERIIIFRCDDEQGRLIGFRGCVVVGNRACDHLAATTERGRELRASYAVFRALIQHCRRLGVEFYDLGGIDPFQNPGVYAFKKQTGAEPLEYLGEWDWATSGWLRWAGNWAIWQRSRVRRAETVIKKPASGKSLYSAQQKVDASWRDADTNDESGN